MEKLLMLAMFFVPVGIDIGFQYLIHRRTVHAFKGCIHCPHRFEEIKTNEGKQE